MMLSSSPTSSQPPAFISLDTARRRPFGSPVDVAGVVFTFLPPKTTRSGEYMVTVTLSDRSHPRGLKARIFSRSSRELPSSASPGDVIVLVGMNVGAFGGETLLLADRTRFSYSLSHFPGGRISCYPSSRRLTPLESTLVSQLRAWWGGSTITVSQPAAVRDRFSLVRDMVVPQLPQYYDMVGKVVKTFPNADWFEVYVTDYTKNKYLYDVSKTQKKWAGPFGQYTLQVTLWGVNSLEARTLIHEGQYVFLQNMRVKWNKDESTYEGNIHEDQRYPDRRDFAILEDMKDPRVRAVMQRERDYERRHIHDKAEEPSSSPLQEQVKEEEEKEEEREEEEREEKEKKEEKKEEKKGPRGSENRKVKCFRPSMPITPIGEILDFQTEDRRYRNVKYHIVCKVIDYKPERLEGFSCFGRGADDDDSDDEVPDGTLKEKRWVWRFALLVEGRDGRTMRIIVEDKDAEYFLDLQATDLSNDAETLARLRTKLRTLWGSLEDRKLRELSALSVHPDSSFEPSPSLSGGGKRKRKKKSKGKDDDPNKKLKTDGGAAEEDEVGEADEEAKFFDACIKEFGIEGERWWRLFETHIFD